MTKKSELDLETGEYNEAKATGLARRNIAYMLLGVMAAVIVMAFVALAWAIAPTESDKN